MVEPVIGQTYFQVTENQLIQILKKGKIFKFNEFHSTRNWVHPFLQRVSHRIDSQLNIKIEHMPTLVSNKLYRTDSNICELVANALDDDILNAYKTLFFLSSSSDHCKNRYLVQHNGKTIDEYLNEYEDIVCSEDFIKSQSIKDLPMLSGFYKLIVLMFKKLRFSFFPSSGEEPGKLAPNDLELFFQIQQAIHQECIKKIKEEYYKKIMTTSMKYLYSPDFALMNLKLIAENIVNEEKD